LLSWTPASTAKDVNSFPDFEARARRPLPQLSLAGHDIVERFRTVPASLIPPKGPRPASWPNSRIHPRRGFEAKTRPPPVKHGPGGWLRIGGREAGGKSKWT